MVELQRGEKKSMFSLVADRRMDGQTSCHGIVHRVVKIIK